MQTTGYRLADEITQLIVDGAFTPGMRLDEGGLAERFGLSRTPVRQALDEVCARGLAERKPNRGVEVVRPDHAALVDRFEALAELEALCAELAAHRARMDGILVLEGLYAQMQRADVEVYQHLNTEFHTQIGVMAGNRQLISLVEGLRLQLHVLRRAQLRDADRRQLSLAEHGQLLAAIARRDAGAARDLMRQHLRAAAAECLTLLQAEQP